MNYHITISLQYVLLIAFMSQKVNYCPQIGKKGISVLHVQEQRSISWPYFILGKDDDDVLLFLQHFTFISQNKSHNGLS